MRYLITGIDHAKGNHMRAEIEAASKAAAEKRAREMGIDVQHIQDVTGADAPRDRHSNRGVYVDGGPGWLFKLVVLIALVAGFMIFVWPRVRGMLHR
jgi:hypothetical protein